MIESPKSAEELEQLLLMHPNIGSSLKLMAKLVCFLLTHVTSEEREEAFKLAADFLNQKRE